MKRICFCRELLHPSTNKFESQFKTKTILCPICFSFSRSAMQGCHFWNHKAKQSRLAISWSKNGMLIVKFPDVATLIGRSLSWPIVRAIQAVNIWFNGSNSYKSISHSLVNKVSLALLSTFVTKARLEKNAQEMKTQKVNYQKMGGDFQPWLATLG